MPSVKRRARMERDAIIDTGRPVSPEILGVLFRSCFPVETLTCNSADTYHQHVGAAQVKGCACAPKNRIVTALEESIWKKLSSLPSSRPLQRGAIAGGLGFYLSHALAVRTRKASLEAADQQIKRAQTRSQEMLNEAKKEARRTRNSAEGRCQTPEKRTLSATVKTRITRRKIGGTGRVSGIQGG